MRVLFVDDEEMILRGIRRMLHGHVDWDISYALGGAEGLEHLKSKPVDVLVADMRMPGMDGAQLLTKAQTVAPGAVRIVLSGHSDQQAVLHTVKPAHQFLSKPCDLDTLVSTLERVHALRKIFINERLRKVITRIDALPVLPAVYHQLVGELESRDASLARVGRILSRDVGLSAGILKTVNSSFFGLPNRVSTPEQAAAMLGLDVLKGLIITEAMFSIFKERDGLNFSLKNLWEHSMRVAGFGRVLCGLQGCRRQDVEEAFLCGLLHDLGKLVLADRLPGEYREILLLTNQENIPIREAELEVLNTDHAELGAYLLGLWGFPEQLVKAVASHHAPSSMISEPALMVTTTHFANYIDHLLVVFNKGYAEHPLDLTYSLRTGLVEKLPGWVEACHNILEGADAENDLVR
ncbi:response regulator [Paucidesulfovibrio longus]|uniref:response regulator n=1 Tax=Paucidesulfovibrio longus TaxID=889 RepID=UPI000687569F|nr:response regulator [Paucidesulfovibrio longus]